jgi:hypothetical protein
MAAGSGTVLEVGGSGTDAEGAVGEAELRVAGPAGTDGAVLPGW